MRPRNASRSAWNAERSSRRCSAASPPAPCPTVRLRDRSPREPRSSRPPPRARAARPRARRSPPPSPRVRRSCSAALSSWRRVSSASLSSSKARRACSSPASASIRACSTASASARFSMRASLTASAARSWSRSPANSATDIGSPASMRRRASFSVRRDKAGQSASREARGAGCQRDQHRSSSRPAILLASGLIMIGAGSASFGQDLGAK